MGPGQRLAEPPGPCPQTDENKVAVSSHPTGPRPLRVRPPGLHTDEGPHAQRLTYLRKGGFAVPFASFCEEDKGEVYGRLMKLGHF